MPDAAQLPGAGRERPLSPHLQIYKPLINMTMSITHRITGAALYFGTLLLAWWLVALASGPEQYRIVTQFCSSWLGMLILLGFTWALITHLLGGIRHLIWDTGRCFGLGQVRALSWATLIGGLMLTAAVWALGIAIRGGL